MVRKRARSAVSPEASRSTSSSPSPQNQHPESWPAPKSQLLAARAFLRECAVSRSTTLLLPDKDADGLCSGLIVYETLRHLGLPAPLLSVHFPAKGSNIHSPAERAAISLHEARFVIATDQGSRGGPPLADAKTLVMDHHWSEEFPECAVVCSAASCAPIATSSTLAYIVCRGILDEEGLQDGEEDDRLRERLEWLCAMGTMGDLGTSFKWEEPFPDMRGCLRRWTKKAIGEGIGLVNAPRRSAEYDVETAWRALLACASPKNILSPSTSADVRRLFEARASVKDETARCARMAPRFSGDGRVALIRISSGAQVHPLIATRWASSLKGARLEIVMCANDGYSAGMTNFACRIAKSGGGNRGGVNIIEALQEYADRVPGLRETMGDDFARGHKEASGGIVPTEQFEKLWEAISCAEGDGERSGKRRRIEPAKGPARQKNTLEGWLKSAG